MSEPIETFVGSPGKQFRALSYGAGDETVLFLHGLSGVAEVWSGTVAALPAGRRYVAIDQRGHGQSYAPTTGYSAADMVGDVREVIRAIGAPVHLVGHSMGARIAIIAASRMPGNFRSVAVIDIGPEASKANIAATVRGIEGRPDHFASVDEAIAFAFRTRTPSASDRAVFLSRLREQPDSTWTWRAKKQALIEMVTKQRSRNYWGEWRQITVPALFVHGGASNEVSVAIAGRMEAENPGVRIERLPGIGHNIPLLAPAELARLLEAHWTTAVTSAT